MKLVWAVLAMAIFLATVVGAIVLLEDAGANANNSEAQLAWAREASTRAQTDQLREANSHREQMFILATTAWIVSGNDNILWIAGGLLLGAAIGWAVCDQVIHKDCRCK